MKSDRKHLLLPGTKASYLVVLITIFINLSALLMYSAENEKSLVGSKNFMSEEVIEENTPEEENIKIDKGAVYDKSWVYYHVSEIPFYHPVNGCLFIEISDPPPERIS